MLGVLFALATHTNPRHYSARCLRQCGTVIRVRLCSRPIKQFRFHKEHAVGSPIGKAQRSTKNPQARAAGTFTTWRLGGRFLLVIAFEPSGQCSAIIVPGCCGEPSLRDDYPELLVLQSSARVVFLISKAQPYLRHVRQYGPSFFGVYEARKFHAFAGVAPIVLRATHPERPRYVFNATHAGRSDRGCQAGTGRSLSEFPLLGVRVDAP